jgi:RNA polymerase sigma factor (sigma-70 family)
MTNKQLNIIKRSIAAELARYKHHKNDHNDLESEAWVRILARWPSYNPEKGALSTWAGWQARGAFMDYTRANYTPRLRNKERTHALLNVHLTDKIHQATQPAAVDNKLVLETLGAAISVKEADILDLYLAGHNLKEIADKYGVHESRISQLLAQIKGKFKHELNTEAQRSEGPLLGEDKKESGPGRG